LDYYKVVKSEIRLKDWLNGLETRLEKLASAYNAASFNKYIGRSAPSLNELDAEISALLSDRTVQATVREWRGKVSDPLIERRLTLFERTFRESEVSKNPGIYELRNTLNDRLINFQPKVGSENLTRGDLTFALRSSPDRAYRQAVFEKGLTSLSVELEPGVRRLIELRNAEARKLGYPTYADLHLELLGTDRPTLSALFERLESLTAAPYRTFLETSRQRYNLDRVEGWDILWLAEQRAELPLAPFSREKAKPLVNDLLGKLGLKPENLPVQVVIKDIPFGGLCFTVRVPDDIRIVSSPKDGYQSFRTLVHEFGHALHATFIRQPSYILKREWGIFNEGMAEVLAYFTHYPEWLQSVTGWTSARVAEYGQDSALKRVLRLRNLMAQAAFEIAAYDDPQTDLNGLLAHYEQRYLGISFDATPRWAASSFPTTHPLYRQNYLLADLIAAQTHATLNRKFGNFFGLSATGRAEVFAFLRENYYGPGASLDWAAKIARATGAVLSPDALLDECGL
jgi:oligoendopeptidase F